MWRPSVGRKTANMVVFPQKIWIPIPSHKTQILISSLFSLSTQHFLGNTALPVGMLSIGEPVKIYALVVSIIAVFNESLIVSENVKQSFL